MRKNEEPWPDPALELRLADSLAAALRDAADRTEPRSKAFDGMLKTCAHAVEEFARPARILMAAALGDVPRDRDAKPENVPDKHRELYHEALRARSDETLQLLALAAEWEMSGSGAQDAHRGDEGEVYANCAEELRAVLKGERR